MGGLLGGFRTTQVQYAPAVFMPEQDSQPRQFLDQELRRLRREDEIAMKLTLQWRKWAHGASVLPETGLSSPFCHRALKKSSALISRCILAPSGLGAALTFSSALARASLNTRKHQPVTGTLIAHRVSPILDTPDKEHPMPTRTLAAIACTVLLASCATPPGGLAASAGGASSAAPTLVGAWEVSSARTRGLGKNLLTFSSDGTFFRSGDSHPVLSGGHGAWKAVAPGVYQASYVAFTFDSSGKWNGVNRNNLELRLAPGGNEFTGSVKSSSRDLQENVVSTGSSTLSGQRIMVQPF